MLSMRQAAERVVRPEADILSEIDYYADDLAVFAARMKARDYYKDTDFTGDAQYALTKLKELFGELRTMREPKEEEEPE